MLELKDQAMITPVVQNDLYFFASCFKFIGVASSAGGLRICLPLNLLLSKK